MRTKLFSHLRFLMYCMCFFCFSCFLFSESPPVSETLKQGDKAFDAKDYALSMKCYLKATKDTEGKAESNIGFLYEKGLGIEKNYRAAMDWYKKAAEKGDSRAECKIGVLYGNGWGVAKNYQKAIFWFQKAAADGDKVAPECLDEINRRFFGYGQVPIFYYPNNNRIE